VCEEREKESERERSRSAGFQKRAEEKKHQWGEGVKGV